MFLRSGVGWGATRPAGAWAGIVVCALLMAGCGAAGPETAAPTVPAPPRAATGAATTGPSTAGGATAGPATNVAPTNAPPTTAPPTNAPPAAATAPAAAATQAPASSGGAVQLAALDNVFEPRTAQVPAGTTVRWTNRGANDHDVTSTDLRTFLSPLLKPGQTFEVTLTQPGSFEYVCSLHDGMIGTVVVR